MISTQHQLNILFSRQNLAPINAKSITDGTSVTMEEIKRKSSLHKYTSIMFGNHLISRDEWLFYRILRSKECLLH